MIARQTWPLLRKALLKIDCAVALTSTSSRTMAGSLPPSSSVTRFSVSAPLAMIRLPVAVDPVKPTFATSGWAVRCGPRSLSSAMMLITPAGNISLQISPSSKAVAGVVGAGLRTMVLPASTAGPIFQHATSNGKFQAMMPTTTPSGMCRTSIKPFSSS